MIPSFDRTIAADYVHPVTYEKRKRTQTGRNEGACTPLPCKPNLVIGKQIGTSLYTWNRVYDLQLKQSNNHPGNTTNHTSDLMRSSGLA